MANILMFNPTNQHMAEVAESDTDAQNRLAEAGFRRVEKYDLVAVYNPGTNTHKTVLKADVQTWINQGFYAEPTFVYHPEKGKRLVSAEEATHLRDKEGWYDSPAKFSKDDKNAIVEKAVKEMKEATKEGGKKAASAA